MWCQQKKQSRKWASDPFLTVNLREAGLLAVLALVVGLATARLWAAYVDAVFREGSALREAQRQAERARDAYTAISTGVAVTSRVACVWAEPVVYLREGESWTALDTSKTNSCWNAMATTAETLAAR